MYDIPVLLVFFNRPDKFSAVFSAVKAIQPKKLFLYQDGPREGNADDVINVRRCREIAESVDWECEVKTLFQEQNVGCDPSGFTAHSWFFNQVEYGIVLEDDCVPSKGFFDLCAYALPKYKDDPRISMVSGMNLLEVFEGVQDPYFFTAHGGIWGWASWARFYKLCDPTYSWLDDKEAVREIKDDFSTKGEANDFLKLARERRNEGIAYFETTVYAAARSRHMLEIVPTRNTITNIGVGEGVHTNQAYEEMSPIEQRYYFRKAYGFAVPEREVPIVRNRVYEKKILLSFADKIRIRIHRFLKRIRKKA